MWQLFILLFAVFFGCSAPKQNEADVPQAFQEGTVLTDIKRSSLRSEYGGDLVEALFAEEVERDTALARLVKNLDGEPRLHAKGTEAFDTFDTHITGYHGDALGHYKGIRDTVLRAGARTADSTALAHYQRLVAGHRTTLSQYDSLAMRNRDLLTVLKLRLSRSAMETYRDKNLPDKSLLDRELDRVQKLEQRLSQQLGM